MTPKNVNFKLLMAMSTSTGTWGEGDLSASTAAGAHLRDLGSEENRRLKHTELDDFFSGFPDFQIPDPQDITHHRTETGWNRTNSKQMLFWMIILTVISISHLLIFMICERNPYAEPVIHPVAAGKHPSHVRRTAVAVRKHWCNRATRLLFRLRVSLPGINLS